MHLNRHLLNRYSAIQRMIWKTLAFQFLTIQLYSLQKILRPIKRFIKRIIKLLLDDDPIELRRIIRFYKPRKS